MGEYADYLIADTQSAYPSWSPFRQHKPTTTRCKYCGSTAVKWRLDAAGWRLHDTERTHPGNYCAVHNCRAPVATPDDFEDIS